MASSRQLLILLFTLFVVLALVSAIKVPPISVVITYPQNTPSYILEQAKEAIIKAGGMVTHEYTIFKGLAATAPAKAFDTVKTMAAEFMPSIEEDQIVTIQGGMSL